MNDFIFNLTVRGIYLTLDGVGQLKVKGKVNTVLSSYIDRNRQAIIKALKKQKQ